MSDDSAEMIRIRIDQADVDFGSARKSADEIAQEKMREPLLIAWYDGMTGTGHPDVHECQNKPGWMTYAESRGGTLTIEVNDGRYILIYSDTHPNET